MFIISEPVYKQNEYMGLKLELVELEKLRSLYESDENGASLNGNLGQNTKATQPLRKLFCPNLQRKLTSTGAKTKVWLMTALFWSSFRANTRKDEIYVLPGWTNSLKDTSIPPLCPASDSLGVIAALAAASH